MRASFAKCGIAFLLLMVSSGLGGWAHGQETAAPAAELPPVPKGIEVLARGPVHEAFATPTAEAVPTKPVPKQPPKALDEMPPEEKPEGGVIWIGGYWAWDDEKNDYLWVSGTWRVPPPGKQWVAGYWKEDGNEWRWVPGFWNVAPTQQAGAQPAASHQVTYLPAPPPPPETAAPGQSPTPDGFYVPGQWVYHNAGYVAFGGNSVWREPGYHWVAGYWARVQPGYVWVAGHYRWTPSGYIYIPGYWDLAIADRGVLYAPVYVDTLVIGPGFVYTPAYCVRDTIVIDAMFVRPCCCHYYFGDYYGPAYRDLGFETCIVYSRRHYDAVFVYERYEHRADPHWESVQIDICLGRSAGRYPCPPRTLVQQNVIVQNNITNVTNVTNVKNVNVVNNNTTINKTTVNNNQVLMPSSQLAAAKGIRTVPLDTGTRLQAQQQAQAIQQVAQQRNQAEVPVQAGRSIQARTASFSAPHQQPVTSRLEAASGVKNTQGMARTTSLQQPGTTAGRAPAGGMTGNAAAYTNHPAGLTGPPPTAAASTNHPAGLTGPPPSAAAAKSLQAGSIPPARPQTPQQHLMPFAPKAQPKQAPARPDPRKKSPDRDK